MERPTPFTLTSDMRAIVDAAHLAFIATVSPDGTPNLSPKGTIRVLDEGRLFYLDIASPRTRENLRRDPRVVLNVVDQVSRRGYRFVGRATLHAGDALAGSCVARVAAEEGTAYSVACVVVVKVEEGEALVSPGYWHLEDERQMRAWWRARRAQLDAAFEAFLASREPWTRDTRS